MVFFWLHYFLGVDFPLVKPGGFMFTFPEGPGVLTLPFTSGGPSLSAGVICFHCIVLLVIVRRGLWEWAAVHPCWV